MGQKINPFGYRLGKMCIRDSLSHEDSIDSATSTIYKGVQRSMPVCVIRNGKPMTMSATA